MLIFFCAPAAKGARGCDTNAIRLAGVFSSGNVSVDGSVYTLTPKPLDLSALLDSPKKESL